MISLLTGGLGIVLRYPLITGLLFFSIFGMTKTYFWGRASVDEAYQKAKIEAIQKDSKENERLSEQAAKIIEEAKEATEKANKITENEIEKIKRINPNQCLDVRLDAIGLR